jgi:hypothetical protein
MSEYNHKGKIKETYLEIMNKFVVNSEPNKELMKVLVDLYACAYEAGESEESQRVHFFSRNLIDEEELLKRCHGELPYDDDCACDDEEDDM